MVHIGYHGCDHIYGPTNMWINSSEDGLRYHRSMDESGIYAGLLDMAKFVRPATGPLGAD